MLPPLKQTCLDGDTLLVTNGGPCQAYRHRYSRVSQVQKLYEDAERRGEGIKTVIALGKKASVFTKSLVDKEEVRLEYYQGNLHIGHKDR